MIGFLRPWSRGGDYLCEWWWCPHWWEHWGHDARWHGGWLVVSGLMGGSPIEEKVGIPGGGIWKRGKEESLSRGDTALPLSGNSHSSPTQPSTLALRQFKASASERHQTASSSPLRLITGVPSGSKRQANGFFGEAGERGKRNGTATRLRLEGSTT